MTNVSCCFARMKTAIDDFLEIRGTNLEFLFHMSRIPVTSQFWVTSPYRLSYAQVEELKETHAGIVSRGLPDFYGFVEQNHFLHEPRKGFNSGNWYLAHILLFVIKTGTNWNVIQFLQETAQARNLHVDLSHAIVTLVCIVFCIAHIKVGCNWWFFSVPEYLNTACTWNKMYARTIISHHSSLFETKVLNISCMMVLVVRLICPLHISYLAFHVFSYRLDSAPLGLLTLCLMLVSNCKWEYISFSFGFGCNVLKLLLQQQGLLVIIRG